MSVSFPAYEFLTLFLIFLFVGVPLIVFMTDMLHLHPGLAVPIAFLLSVFIGLFLLSRKAKQSRTR